MESSADIQEPNTTAFTHGRVIALKPGDFSRQWFMSIRPRAIVIGFVAAVVLIYGGGAIDRAIDPESLRFAPSERSMLLVAVEPSGQLTGWVEADRSWNGTAWLAIQFTWSLLISAVFGAFIIRDVALTSATGRAAGWKEILNFTLPRTFQFWITQVLAVVAAVGLRSFGWVGSVAGYIPMVGSSIETLIVSCFHVLAWFMVGVTAIAWPVMMAAQCVDGCDCFDGLSRGFNFVLTRPIQFALMLMSLTMLGFAPVGLICLGLEHFFNVQGQPVFLAGCVYAAVFTWAPFAFVELRRQIDSVEVDEIFIPRNADFEPVPLSGRVAHPVPSLETP